MNILFIAKNVTLSGRAGDSVHVREITYGLAEKGNKIYMIGRDLQGVSAEVYAEYQAMIEGLNNHENIEIFLMRSRKKLSYPINRDLQALKNSLMILRSRKIDLIYSRSFNAYLEAFLSKLFRVPLVLEINGLEFQEREAGTGKKAGAVTRLLKTLSRYFFRHARKIVSVSEKIKTELTREFGVRSGKVTVIPNGVNDKLFKPMPEDKRLKSQLKLSDKSNVICFVGAFDPWHGLEGLTEAAGLVINEIPETKLLLVGDGSVRARIEKTAKSRGIETSIIITGRVPYDDVPKYINLSHVCVAPYPAEKKYLMAWSPLKLYEYLACGKPVVATKVGSMIDVIERSRGGLLVKPDAPEALKAGILELLRNENKRRKMGSDGRRYVLKNCTWSQTADRVLRVCNRALGNHGSIAE